jgi:hypothetical protein
MSGKGCGLLPTTRASDYMREKFSKESSIKSATKEGFGDVALPYILTLLDIEGQEYPMIYEGISMNPIGWTALKPLAMDKCQLAQPWHGLYSLPKIMIDWLSSHGVELETK